MPVQVPATEAGPHVEPGREESDYHSDSYAEDDCGSNEDMHAEATQKIEAETGTEEDYDSEYEDDEETDTAAAGPGAVQDSGEGPSQRDTAGRDGDTNKSGGSSGSGGMGTNDDAHSSSGKGDHDQCGKSQQAPAVEIAATSPEVNGREPCELPSTPGVLESVISGEGEDVESVPTSLLSPCQRNVGFGAQEDHTQLGVGGRNSSVEEDERVTSPGGLESEDHSSEDSYASDASANECSDEDGGVGGEGRAGDDGAGDESQVAKVRDDDDNEPQELVGPLDDGSKDEAHAPSGECHHPSPLGETTDETPPTIKGNEDDVIAAALEERQTAAAASEKQTESQRAPSPNRTAAQTSTQPVRVGSAGASTISGAERESSQMASEQQASATADRRSGLEKQPGTKARPVAATSTVATRSNVASTTGRKPVGTRALPNRTRGKQTTGETSNSGVKGRGTSSRKPTACPGKPVGMRNARAICMPNRPKRRRKKVKKRARTSAHKQEAAPMAKQAGSEIAGSVQTGSSSTTFSLSHLDMQPHINQWKVLLYDSVAASVASSSQPTSNRRTRSAQQTPLKPRGRPRSAASPSSPRRRGVSRKVTGRPASATGNERQRQPLLDSGFPRPPAYPRTATNQIAKRPAAAKSGEQMDRKEREPALKQEGTSLTPQRPVTSRGQRTIQSGGAHRQLSSNHQHRPTSAPAQAVSPRDRHRPVSRPTSRQATGRNLRQYHPLLSKQPAPPANHGRVPVESRPDWNDRFNVPITKHVQVRHARGSVERRVPGRHPETKEGEQRTSGRYHQSRMQAAPPQSHSATGNLQTREARDDGAKGGPGKTLRPSARHDSKAIASLPSMVQGLVITNECTPGWRKQVIYERIHTLRRRAAHSNVAECSPSTETEQALEAANQPTCQAKDISLTPGQRGAVSRSDTAEPCMPAGMPSDGLGTSSEAEADTSMGLGENTPSRPPSQAVTSSSSHRMGPQGSRRSAETQQEESLGTEEGIWWQALGIDSAMLLQDSFRGGDPAAGTPGVPASRASNHPPGRAGGEIDGSTGRHANALGARTPSKHDDTVAYRQGGVLASWAARRRIRVRISELLSIAPDEKTVAQLAGWKGGKSSTIEALPCSRGLRVDLFSVDEQPTSKPAGCFGIAGGQEGYQTVGPQFSGVVSLSLLRREVERRIWASRERARQEGSRPRGIAGKLPRSKEPTKRGDEDKPTNGDGATESKPAGATRTFTTPTPPANRPVRGQPMESAGHPVDATTTPNETNHRLPSRQGGARARRPMRPSSGLYKRPVGVPHVGSPDRMSCLRGLAVALCPDRLVSVLSDDGFEISLPLSQTLKHADMQTVFQLSAELALSWSASEEDAVPTDSHGASPNGEPFGFPVRSLRTKVQVPTQTQDSVCYDGEGRDSAVQIRGAERAGRETGQSESDSGIIPGSGGSTSVRLPGGDSLLSLLDNHSEVELN